MTNPIYLPSSDPEDWRRLLADPDKHWRRGYSAYELAYAWAGKGWPAAVSAALRALSANVT